MRGVRWRVLVGAAVVAGIVLAFGVVYFQPQKLFINQRVDEANPAATTAAGQARQASPVARPETVLSTSNLQSLEHQSSGTVVLIELAGGGRILRLENLATSNGPDLRVYLSTAPASTDWHGYDRDYVDLGALKGNLGNQNYTLPNSVDIARYRSAVIWCRQFKVGFAVAPLSG
jgi:Electron transfer DM13